MRYPDYRYVEVAVNGAHNRNQIHEKELLGDPTGYRDTYMSIFRYNDEMREYFQSNIKVSQNGRHYRSVTGFDGSAYADWIPFDVDNNDINKALYEVRNLIDQMNKHDIPVDSCRFYFSGSKGFHVMIPSNMAGVVPTNDIHKRFKNIADNLAGSVVVDMSIYDKVRIFRMPNTINSKTGLYKVELYPFEIINNEIEHIKELAKNPREELDVPETKEMNRFLKQWFREDVKESRPSGSTKGVKAYHCMQKLMDGVTSGERDNVGLRVMAHLRRSGLSPEMMWSALISWNQQNSPPLNENEVARIYRQGIDGYEFGCHDHILKENCDPNCVFYRKEWGRF